MKKIDKQQVSLHIEKEQVDELFNARFIKLYDLKYKEGKHYYNATRRNIDDLVATKSDEEAGKMLPDAVSAFVILKLPNDEPRLLLFHEYRYPTGRYLLSIPAGLIDPQDKSEADPILTTARREIFEETGLRVKDTDRIYTVSPLSYSTPGMTDESNALVCAVLDLEGTGDITTDHLEGSELFSDFILATKAEAKEYLKNARDDEGQFFSLMTWSALMYFISDMWKENE